MSEWLSNDRLDYEEIRQIRDMTEEECNEFVRKRNALIAQGKYNPEEMLPRDILSMTI